MESGSKDQPITRWEHETTQGSSARWPGNGDWKPKKGLHQTDTNVLIKTHFRKECDQTDRDGDHPVQTPIQRPHTEVRSGQDVHIWAGWEKKCPGDLTRSPWSFTLVMDPPVRLWRGSSARVLYSSERRDERGLLYVVHWLGGAGSEVTHILLPGKPNRRTKITLPFKDSFTTSEYCSVFNCIQLLGSLGRFVFFYWFK